MPITDHPMHIKLEDNAILWRYMSFSKYESLLRDKALFFCRADKFSDPFECSVPKREANYRSSEHKFRTEENVFGRTDSKFNEDIAKKRSNDMAYTHKMVKTATTVNCWHINNHESDAMWQLYLKNNEGIAVKTSKGRLYKAFENTKVDIGMSKVRYIDFENGIWYHEKEFPVTGYNLIVPLIHKRLEFKHENELRLYHRDYNREKEGYWDTQQNKNGELIPVAVEDLVEAVIFHPTADIVAKNKIIDVTKRYGFDVEFQESKMGREPIY